MTTLKSKIGEELETLTSYYFKGGNFEDQDLYCEDISGKISDLIREELGEKIEDLPIFGYLSSGHIGNEPLPVISKEQVHQLLNDILKV